MENSISRKAQGTAPRHGGDNRQIKKAGIERLPARESKPGIAPAADCFTDSSLAGQRFGRWTATGQYTRNAKGERRLFCRCDCGTERYVLERSLRRGDSQSCGCLRNERVRQSATHDLTGCVFGGLTVLGKSELRDGFWRCRCECGSECEASGTELASGRKTSCGCLDGRRYAFADITGYRFGRLTALYPTNKRDAKGFVIWRCRCDCGNETDVSYNSLMYSHRTSCGCRKKEHSAALGEYLARVDGTSIDSLKSRTLPRNNTTGYRGVYYTKGRYIAKIVFKKKQYLLGSYDNAEAAAAARAAAQDRFESEILGYYDKWAEKAASDPVWAGDNPPHINIERNAYGGLDFDFTPKL